MRGSKVEAFGTRGRALQRRRRAVRGRERLPAPRRPALSRPHLGRTPPGGALRAPLGPGESGADVPLARLAVRSRDRRSPVRRPRPCADVRRSHRGRPGRSLPEAEVALDLSRPVRRPTRASPRAGRSSRRRGSSAGTGGPRRGESRAGNAPGPSRCRARNRPPARGGTRDACSARSRRAGRRRYTLSRPCASRRRGGRRARAPARRLRGW